MNNMSDSRNMTYSDKSWNFYENQNKSFHCSEEEEEQLFAKTMDGKEVVDIQTYHITSRCRVLPIKTLSKYLS